MKNIQKLKTEQTKLKKKLVKLIDFINSEGYYNIEESEKMLLANQRMGMEIYLNSLTQRIYGPNTFNYSGNILPMMLMSMFSGVGQNTGSADYLKRKFDADKTLDQTKD